MKNILVIGFSTRNVVCSGKRAGYNMYSIDAFCDYDLIQCSSDARKLDLGEVFDASCISHEELREIIDSFNIDFEAVILGSGFESIGLDNLPCPVLANDPAIMAEVSNKYLFSKRVERLGFVHPRTVLLSEIEKLEMPLMVKPACSGGGIFNMKVKNESDIGQIREKLTTIGMPSGKDQLIAQEYIDGTPVSVSVISTKEKAVAIAVNEQLIGIPWLTTLPFAYCGNITPCKTPYDEEMKQISEELIIELGLVGSNGVDFIISEEGPVLIEVNARFQGSLDSVEMSTGINLLDAHVKAFNGELSFVEEQYNKNNQFAARVILYADKQITVTEEVQKKLLKKNFCDIPSANQVIATQEPVISVLCSGKTRDDVLSSVRESVMFIRESLNLIES